MARMDKWLWAARFFKTRALAVEACELGRVEVNGQPTKPAREVHLNMMLRVKTPGGDFHIKVLGISDQRGPATAAQALYEETAESKSARERVREQNRFAWQPETERAGRPSKRDRREIDRLRSGYS
jgi:ribosome-associated heat shock protein Hsp15